MATAAVLSCEDSRQAFAKPRARQGRRRTRAKRAHWAGEGQEAKGVRCSLVDQARIVQVLSWDQVCTDADVEAALTHVQAAGSIPEDQGRWCVMGDGAKWIGTQVKARIPTAVQILDYDHCRAHVPKVGGLQFGEDAAKAHAWVEGMMARLFWGDGDWASAGLEARQPRDYPAAEEIRKRSGFLRNSAGRVVCR